MHRRPEVTGLLVAPALRAAYSRVGHKLNSVFARVSSSRLGRLIRGRGSMELILRVIGRSETSTAPDLQAALAHLGSEWMLPSATLSVIAQVGLDLYQHESNEIRRQQIVYAALKAL